MLRRSTRKKEPFLSTNSKQTDQIIPGPSSRRAAVVVGIFLVLFGLVANQWVLTYLFSDDRILRFSGKMFLIWSIDISSIALGAFLILYRTRRKVSAFSVNVLVFTASTVILIILIELIYPLVQQSIPVQARNYIPWPYHILAQSTKRSLVPENYTAIFGDSYAEGSGDWKYKTGRSSADILASQLDKDVVTFGYGGANSIEGIVLKPLIALRRLRYRVNIANPNTILIYFYEGNDLTGNLDDFSRRLPNYTEYTGSEILEEELFHNYLDFLLLRYDGLIPDPVLELQELIASRFIATGLFWNILKRLTGTWNVPGLFEEIVTNSSPKINREPPSVISGEIGEDDRNLVKIDNRILRLPKKLNGPELQLTPDERTLGLALFTYCITYAKSYFTQSRFIIVYVPSPLSSYDLESTVLVNNYRPGRADEFNPEHVYKTSDWIANEVRDIASELEIGFIDIRNALRSAGTLVHGPNSYLLNKNGYEILSEVILEYLRTNERGVSITRPP
jgi:hypothetical protein